MGNQLNFGSYETEEYEQNYAQHNSINATFTTMKLNIKLSIKN